MSFCVMLFRVESSHINYVSFFFIYIVHVFKVVLFKCHIIYLLFISFIFIIIFYFWFFVKPNAHWAFFSFWPTNPTKTPGPDPHESSSPNQACSWPSAPFHMPLHTTLARLGPMVCLPLSTQTYPLPLPWPSAGLLP